MYKFKKDDIVFVNGAYSIAEKCKITDYIENEPEIKQSAYMVHSLEIGGTFGVLEDSIFATKEEAVQDAVLKSKEQTEKYCKEIKNMDDLLKFPLDHCLCGDYTDYEAKQAYKIRVKEIVGLNLLP